MQAILWTLAAFLAFAAASHEKKIVCYFASWSVYRSGNGKIDINQDIDPHLCTHLIYAFVGLKSNGSIAILDPKADLCASEFDGGLDGYNKFNKLRGVNPRLKTLISIGGWNEGSVTFSKVVGDPLTRATFVENSVMFVRRYGFDGCDVSWDYPNQRGGVEADKENFVLLLKELRERFEEEGLILSVAVGASEFTAKTSYIIAEVAKYVHFVNLMTFDFHQAADNKTGVHAPLYAGSWEIGYERLLNVNASVHYWLSQGTPAEKLIIGMPFYAHSYTLDDPNNHEIGAPAHKPGTAGPYTREVERLGYNEICESQLAGGWEITFQFEQRVPYAVKGDQWIGYDNRESIREKAEFINELRLGGAMVYSIETDDFRGICGKKNQLLKTLNCVLRG